MSKKISRRSFLLYFNVGWVASCFPLALSACQSTSKSPGSSIVEVENAPIVVPTNARPDGFTAIGTISELDKNGYINYERVDYKKALVVRHPNQKAKLIAIDPTCPHLGCLVKLVAKEQIFQCPCHLGKFDLQGKPKSGPPPSPLKKYEYKLEGEKVLVKITNDPTS